VTVGKNYIRLTYIIQSKLLGKDYISISYIKTLILSLFPIILSNHYLLVIHNLSYFLSNPIVVPTLVN